ncbi:laminin G domain protein [Trichuris suis]|nr:laminin G domain protein [Trichuris suis]
MRRGNVLLHFLSLACSCNHCGAERCETQTGKCSCKQNVEGENCDHCVNNAWGFHYCQGCQMCNCAPASMSRQCDPQTGQCPCHSGASGIFCDKCAEGYWNYSLSGCQKCDCESDLAMGTICDTATGQCHCMEGATGIRCENCLPGYVVIPHHGCQVCDECVLGLVEDMRQTARTFDEMEFDMQNVTIEQVFSQRLNRLQSSTNSLQVIGTHFDFKARKRVFPQQYVHYMKSLIAERTNDVGPFTVPHNKHLDEVTVKLRRFAEDAVIAKLNAVDLTTNAFEISRYIRLFYLRLKDSAEKMNTFSDSLKADSSSRNRDKLTETWLKEASDFLTGIKATTMEESAKSLMISAEETESITSEVQEFENSLADLHNHTASLMERGSTMIISIRDLQSNLNRSRVSLEKAEMSCVEMETTPVIAKIPDSNTSKIEKTLSEAYEGMNSAQEIITGTVDLGRASKKYWDNLNLQSRPLLLSKLNKNRQALEKTQDLKKKAIDKAEQLDIHAEDLVQQFSGSTENVSEAVEASSAYRQVVEVLNSTKETLSEIQITLDDKLSLAALKPLLQDLGDMVNASLNEMRIATGIRSDITNRVRKELSSQEEVISNFRTQLNAAIDILKEMKKGADVYEQADFRISQAKSFASDALTIAKSGQDSFGWSAERYSTFVDMAKKKISEQVFAISHMKRANANIEQVSVVVPEVLGNVSSLRQAFVKSVTAMNAAETGITLLREKIARARNLANMVKLGVRFYLNSSLELYKGDLLKKVEAQTDISLFFRTQYPDGLLFFLGNQENPAIRANDVLMDYLALEVKDGRARCIFDLGAGDASVTSNRVVSDNRWHKASVERVGKLLTLKVSTEGEPDDQTEIFSHGSKSILNLNKNYSKLFIGGVPTSFELPKTIVNHRFNGQIEGLVLHGEPKGLWNFALDGRNNTFGAPERRELHSEASLNGIHLNGKGYAVLQRLMWNPRQHIDLVFYFKTYASEGLMFYAGKDRDVLAVELKRGHVRLYLNLGSGGALLTTPRKYNDGNYHRVQVKREGKHAILSVNLADTVEGYSPGGLNHLDVTDTFYVGGVPYEVLPAKSPLSRHGFHGCIERMHVNGHNVNLNRYVEGYFVEPGCPERPIRLVAFDRPGGSVKFSSLTWNAEMELTFRFRTVLQNTVLLFVSDDQGVNSLWVALNEGNILMKSRSAGVDTDYVTVNVKNFSDGDWHHLSVSKSGEQLSMDIDDLYSNLTWLNNLGVYAQSENTLQLGALSVADQSLRHTTDFVGCVSDVTFNRRMLNFATAERSGEYISFDVCPDELFPSLDDNFLALENLTEPGNVSSIPGAAAGGGKESSCALRLKPVRHTPCGGNCYRFGVEKNSRLEFEALSSPIDSKSEISLELRTNAHSGFVLFAWNQKMDYLALYLKDGRLIFEFDSGSGPAVLQSKSDIFDYQWHYVKLIRRGRDGTLWLDDVFQAEGKSNGLASRIELKRPFYVGGLPDDTYRLAQRQRTNFQSIAAVFSGCLRNLLLNGNPLGDISNSVGVYPCDNSEERGLYFGEQPGYFFLEHKFQVNKMFSLDLQVKPRINDGILFVIATPSGSEIITSQLNEGDLLVSLEQNGSKPQQLRMKMKPKNLTCDGHWHTIRLLKVNNFLTVGFDGSNAHTQLKKTTSFANGEKFNLYLGGIPESFVAKGLLSKGYFVGCMRDISLEPTNGKQRTYTDFKEIPLFGSASVDGCPLD